MKGYVKRLPHGKDFGFVRGEDNKDYFFHKENFNGHWKDLVEDMDANLNPAVTFDVEIPEPSKGPRARKVNRVDYPNIST